MSGSSVPGVVAGLVTRFNAAGLSGVTVIDGPAYDPPSSFLAVGWDRTDQPSVLAQRGGESAGFSEAEVLDVSCLLSFAYDDPEVTTVRGALFDAFGLLCAALAADRTLGGAAMTSRVSAYDLTPVLTEVGTVADLRFTVTARATGL